MGSNNPSVRRFKTDMLDLVNKAKYDLHQELLAMGEELVGNIQNAIPHSETGHLKESVRKQDATREGGLGLRLTVLVRAGGPKTTRRSPSGHSFDYALAEEFGTSKETPRPFFYSTVRFYRANAVEDFRETFAQTIAENNRMRAARGDVFTDATGFTADRSGTAQRGGTITRTIPGDKFF